MSNFLGDTIEKIAFEKAGIIKPGAPVVVSAQGGGGSGRARTAGGATARAAHHPWPGFPLPRRTGPPRLSRTSTACSTCPCRACPAVIRSSTPGPRSPPCANARRIFHTRPSRHGMVSASWPGRLQNIGRGKLAALAPDGAELWLDGGHNEAGGRVLAEAMADFEDKAPRPLVLLYGGLQTKDAEGFPAPFRWSGARGRRCAGARRTGRTSAGGNRGHGRVGSG